MTKQLCLPFPIRHDFLAQIVVPSDMTKVEANRLCAFVMSMAQPDTVEPAIKQSLTIAEQSAELDAGMAAQHYCRGLWGAARGHSDWRKVHEHFASGYKQGRYDELQAQGPSPWPDDAPEVHYKRGYGVALSDAEEAIDDECRERVVTASDCIELIRNLGAAPTALPVEPAPESKA